MNSNSATKTSTEAIELNIKIIEFENPLSLKIKEFTIKQIIDSYEKEEKLEDILIRESTNKNILEICKFFRSNFQRPYKS